MNKYRLPFLGRVGLSISILGCASLGIMPAIAFDTSLTEDSDPIGQVTSVSQLTDVDPTH
ncbi:hypothetical protein [Microseira wollei]|uniref:Uncharacterized protein n=1 Tax=Microseira wollei NIES-4236 TaxID=2530354 RepID=A0AAV3X9T5_9CYAN|nr:hypothetical protein [Microseira wollei]GET38143.1 hypothetical protein MiSe_28970 [Microseira wollei NIES-4236]